MPKYFLQTIFLIGSIFLIGISTSYADKILTDDLIKLLKKGSESERLSAAKKLGGLGHEAVKAEKRLLKLLKKNKNSSNGVVYLSALLSISDNHQKAYKAFGYNAFKQKGSKHEKYRKASDYLSKLSDVHPVPASLIDYIKALRSSKKIYKSTPNIILSQLIIKNPELTPQFVEELETDTLNTVRILSLTGDKVVPYLSHIKNVMDKAPFDSLKLLLKHEEIDSDVLKFALSKADKPVEEISFYSFRNNYSLWNVAVDILANKATENPPARNKLFALINTKDWKYVTKAISKYSSENSSLQNDIFNRITVKLENEVEDLSYSKNEYRSKFPAYDMCLYIAGHHVSDPDHINILLQKAKYWSDLIVRVGCTYALNAVNEPSKEVIDYLESTLEKDVSIVTDQVKMLLSGMNSTKDQMVQSQFRASLAPDLTSLYSAAILLKYSPDHKKAKSIVDEYYEANIPFLKTNREQTGPGQGAHNFPSAISEGGIFKAFYSEMTPIDALNFAYANDELRWQKLIEDGLQSDVYARSINTARLIMEKKRPLTKQMQASLLQKSSSKINRSQSVIFIRALEYATPDEDVLSILNEIMHEKYATRKLAAKKILTHLNARIPKVVSTN